MSVHLNGVDQYLAYADAIRAASPITMSVWVRLPNRNDTAFHIMGAGGSGNSLRTLRAFSSTPTTAGATIWSRRQGQDRIVSTSSLTVGAHPVWFHCAVVVSEGGVDRAAFINGTNKATNIATADVAPYLSNFVIGGWTFSDGWPPTVDIQAIEVQLAHACVWDTVLSDAQIAELAAGANPKNVSADNLVAYWPLYDGPGDEVGEFNLVEFGDPTYNTNEDPSVDPDIVVVNNASQFAAGVSFSGNPHKIEYVNAAGQFGAGFGFSGSTFIRELALASGSFGVGMEFTGNSTARRLTIGLKGGVGTGYRRLVVATCNRIFYEDIT